MTRHLERALVVQMGLKKPWSDPLQETVYQISWMSQLLSLQTCMNSLDVAFPTL